MPVFAAAEPCRNPRAGRTGVPWSPGFTGPRAGVGTDPAWASDVALHNGFRVATLDGDAPLLFERGSAFAAAVRQVGTK
ncbi:hypothetical protein [Prauserella alba]|uniref:Uncharacterized protein n=1 Tax=Prauserella alba TaxID=176898 RepID=A0ABN1VU86_9PSEU|nr:hypothetical protein [Prauserella alba]